MCEMFRSVGTQNSPRYAKLFNHRGCFVKTEHCSDLNVITEILSSENNSKHSVYRDSVFITIWIWTKPKCSPMGHPRVPFNGVSYPSLKGGPWGPHMIGSTRWSVRPSQPVLGFSFYFNYPSFLLDFEWLWTLFSFKHFWIMIMLLHLYSVHFGILLNAYFFW